MWILYLLLHDVHLFVPEMVVMIEPSMLQTKIMRKVIHLSLKEILFLSFCLALLSKCEMTMKFGIIIWGGLSLWFCQTYNSFCLYIFLFRFKFKVKCVRNFMDHSDVIRKKISCKIIKQETSAKISFLIEKIHNFSLTKIRHSFHLVQEEHCRYAKIRLYVWCLAQFTFV